MLKKKIKYLMQIKDEWTQQEFLLAKKELEDSEQEILLVDTILSPIKGVDTITYNPYEMQQKPKGSIFVFYCDTGKSSLDRLEEYKKRFPDHICVSLHGGRGYWRPYLKAEML